MVRVVEIEYPGHVAACHRLAHRAEREAERLADEDGAEGDGDYHAECLQKVNPDYGLDSATECVGDENQHGYSNIDNERQA